MPQKRFSAGAQGATGPGGPSGPAGPAGRSVKAVKCKLKHKTITCTVTYASSTRSVVALLRRRASAGCAIVAATHNSRLAAAADRTVRLVDGRVVA